MSTEGQWMVICAESFVIGSVLGFLVGELIEGNTLRKKMEAQYQESLRLMRVGKQLLGMGKENGHG